MGLDLADIQKLIEKEREHRYSRINDLVDLTITKLCSYLSNVDSSFPFDAEKMSFEISEISEDLRDLTVDRFCLVKWNEDPESADISYELDLSENDTSLFMSFNEFKKHMPKQSDKSLYHLKLNTTEWGMFFKGLELRGFNPVLYIEKAYDSSVKAFRDFSGLDPSIKLESNWRDVIKIVIFVDSQF